MEHSSYPMKKLGYDNKDYGKEKMNSCSFYVKYFLFCVSIIQLLIILGLVLFMVYGNAYGNQQMRRLLAQNQSLRCIEEKMKVQAEAEELGKKLNKSRVQVTKLSTANKTLNALSICLDTNGIQFHSNCSTIKPPPNKLAPTKNPVSNQDIALELIMYVLNPKNGITQLRNCSGAQNTLKLAKVEKDMLETKHKIDLQSLIKQKDNLNSQLQGLKNNCTSISQDFQKFTKDITSKYEASFNKLLNADHSSLRQQLYQLKGDCTPLISAFKMEVQSQLDQTNSQIRTYFEGAVSKTSRLANVEMQYAECQAKTKALEEEIKAKKTVHEKDTEAHLTEKLKLLQDLRVLMTKAENVYPGDGQSLSAGRSVNQKKVSSDLLSERIQQLLGSRLSLQGNRQSK
ncbi:plasmalemma vesicle associated protein b [Callorhinchus milii]|uniref:plasmalemma vesicle associated protein b n=1 Tax=Callorhinchus milii TaxID=7868 RepID=UPI00045718D8|nr:plasmalemma vesicle associated protein b [Callorhinchus milii]|eukprot:gi/632961948/ref/XP_007897041.1/ PREDICTED: plasmalemma vesicle-associated protein [Callorhinchus milii]